MLALKFQVLLCKHNRWHSPHQALNWCKEGSKARAPVHTLPCQPHSDLNTCNASTHYAIDINKKIHCRIDASATARMTTLTQSSCFATSVLESAATHAYKHKSCSLQSGLLNANTCMPSNMTATVEYQGLDPLEIIICFWGLSVCEKDCRSRARVAKTAWALNTARSARQVS